MKPIGIVLDTNILIYLLDPEKYDKNVFHQFFRLIVSYRVVLIIPNQVITEWNRHKSGKSESFVEGIVKPILKHKALTKHIKDQEEAVELIKRIDNIV